MGKVLKIAAVVVGIAVNVFPVVGQTISGAIWGTLTGGALGAASAAVFVAAHGIVAGISMFGLTSPIADMAPSGGIINFPRGSPTAAPKRGQWHWRRFFRIESMGDCLDPNLPHGWQVLVDRVALIREGDVVAIRVNGSENAVLLKRFVEATADHIEVATNNPRQQFTIPRDSIVWMYRGRAMARNVRALRGVRRRILRDANAHMERLGRIIIRDDRDLV